MSNEINHDLDLMNENESIKNYVVKINTKLNMIANVHNFKRDYLTRVEIYAIFHRISEIDNVKEQFKANIFMEAKWIDDSIDDSKESKFDVKKYWTPSIYIENSIGKIKQDIKYRIEKRDDKIYVIESRNIESVFYETLELKNFPLDIQDLGIAITTERSVKEVLFESSVDYESAVNKESFQMKTEWFLYSNLHKEINTFNDVWRGYQRPILKISTKIGIIKMKIWSLFFLNNLIFIILKLENQAII